MIIGKNTYFLLETNSFLGKGNVYDVFILFMKLMGGVKMKFFSLKTSIIIYSCYHINFILISFFLCIRLNL